MPEYFVMTSRLYENEQSWHKCVVLESVDCSYGQGAI